MLSRGRDWGPREQMETYPDYSLRIPAQGYSDHCIVSRVNDSACSALSLDHVPARWRPSWEGAREPTDQQVAFKTYGLGKTKRTCQQGRPG